MSIHTVFETWKHLDHLLSDREWLTTDDDGNTDIRMMILYESWQAIKTQMIETRIDSTPLHTCPKLPAVPHAESARLEEFA